MSSKTFSSQDDERAVAASPATPAARDFELEQIRQAIKGIRHGEVHVTIRDGVVIQIERIEKHRLR
ncbi:YezD family protein [Singulisphaera sp. PoT]|uniref:YezD family protein n=1 Tax=Singulisphaera sp. PoT TaxID=3411797 RepID=UPI003BF52CCD